MEVKHIRTYLVIFLLLLAFFVITSSEYKPEHSIYNEGALGASSLRNGLENELGMTTDRFLISPFFLSENQNENPNIITIIGSQRSYTSQEIQTYNDYVSNGGTLILFEDFGPSKEIAESMGVNYFDSMIRESNENIAINRPTQFFVKDLATSELLGLENPLLLMVSEATAVVDISGFQSGDTLPILLSFSSAFIDVDNDNEMDTSDITYEAGLPLGVFKQYGDGYLIAISDASIPLNQFWNRKISLNEQIVEAQNAIWTLLMFNFIQKIANTSNVVFDESHQQFSLSSGAGLINLLLGSWIGYFNSRDFAIFTTGLILFIGLLTYRKEISKEFRRRSRRKDKFEIDYVSKPTLGERALSEQYILFQSYNTKYIQIANSELYNKIKEVGYGDGFLEDLEDQYGDITASRSFSELFEIHLKMREFVENELIKWL